MNQPAKFLLRNSAEGRVIGVVGDKYRFLVTGEESGGRYAMFEATVPPGGGPPPHVHRNEDETFYVIEGEVTFQAGEERITATEGTFVNLPIGQPHAFKNESGQVAKMIITVTPAGLDEMFLEAGTEFDGDFPPLPGEEDIQKLLAIAPKYGIEILVP